MENVRQDHSQRRGGNHLYAHAERRFAVVPAQIMGGGNGVIYAMTNDVKLMIYHSLDPMGGEMRWSGPVQVGTGWDGFAQLFSTGNGEIYELATDVSLATTGILPGRGKPTLKWVGPIAAGAGFNPAARIIPLLPWNDAGMIR